MKLIHAQEPAKKEDGPNSDIKSKIPLTDGFTGGAGRALKATILGISLVAALGIAKTGCTYDPQGLGNVDASQDADASSDAGPDVDAGQDADADMDAGDGGHDSGPDVDADADGGHDAGPDADAGPTACVDADVGTYSGVIATATPQTVGGYVFEYLGKSGSDALIRISCGGSILEDSLVCPLGVDTIRDDVPSGRRITITPSAAGATSANVSISVELH